MQDWWIYHHFINTIWFLLFLLSIPSILGLGILFYYLKNVHQEGNQNDQNTQQADNQNPQQAQNQENQNSQQVKEQPT
ncbi:hypothetical protein BIV60_08215 [Bacillus sp. MUM 116]|uniref:hypothetical protein n=1 Tax=Bacillus sp. MUM 116 TaxID=1678002 RepID=UPI0008F5771C|nr:hypothetical protein [Bacillus sp. MUM 116]OIK15727.1 hypothetical protein BIV60_08215 [Bacillus sp. MUM 116]